MKREQKLIVTGFLVIAAYDALTSIASRELSFNYTYLASGSFFIYGLFGFLGAKNASVRSGILVAAALGLFDATVGWKISMLLKANTGHLNNNPTASLWIVTAIFNSALAAVCGLIGAILAKYLNRFQESKA